MTPLTMTMRKKPNQSAPVLLSQEQIDARRIPIEEAEFNLSKNKNWQCPYCTKRFTNETNFMKHFCEPKRRSEEMATPLGSSAYWLYTEWMRIRKFGQPSTSAFIESKYYRSFVNFAQMVANANIARPEKYISIMVEADILPVLWCRDDAYALYLEWVDKLSDPYDEVASSVNYLMDVCERDSVDLGDVFAHLGPNNIIGLIRQRRLTPWLLFCSASFGRFLKTLDREHLKIFNSVVNASFWSDKFARERAIVENVKTIAREVGL